jgi:hypothetical protein
MQGWRRGAETVLAAREDLRGRKPHLKERINQDKAISEPSKIDFPRKTGIPNPCKD